MTHTISPPAIGAWPERRLRLKHHVYFCDTPLGVQFDAGSNTVLVPGAGLYRLMERVIALMDQGASLPAVQAALPARLQPVVLRTLEALEANAMLLDDTDQAPWIAQGPTPGPLAEFIKYLQDRADPATRRARWAAWRAGSVLVAGGGHALKAAARALADSGVGTLRVHLVEHDSAIAAPELLAHLQAAGIADQAIGLHATLPAAADLEGACIAVWAGDAPDASAAGLHFEQLAAAADVPAIVALRTGGRALVAPPSEPGCPGMHELAAWEQAGRAEPHSPASLALMGVVAAQAAMDHHFGIAPQQWRRQVRHISAWLEVTRHPLVGAGDRPAILGPLVGAAPETLSAAFDQPPERELSTYEQQRMRLAPWFDPLFGPFAWRSTGASGALLSQLPLYHDAIAVRSPRGDARPSQWVVGWGLNAEQAGTRALTLALDQLAARLTPGAAGAAFASAFDAERWRALALARAVVAQRGFETQRHVAWLDVQTLQDPTIHLLRQLLRHFAEAAPRVLLHWRDDAPACVAQVWLGDEPVASACDATALDAVREALGLACSQRQVPDSARSIGPAGRWAAPARAQWRDAPADLSRAPGAAGLRVRWVRAEGLDLPSSIHCGHAVVEFPEVFA